MPLQALALIGVKFPSIAIVLQIDLSHTEAQKVVEGIYLQASRREYVDALLPELSGIPGVSLYREHLDDVASAIGSAPVA